MSTASGNTTTPAQDMAQMRQQIEALTAQVQTLQTGNAGVLTLPKFPKPEPFDGTKGDVRTFLTQAKAYLRVNTTISNPAAKILCIGNLLTGKAMEWWEPTLRDYLDNETPEDETARIFIDYDNFEELLQTSFGDPDEIRTATRKLKALKQTGSAQHLVREFRRIASHIDWDEDSTMELLYDALREDVKDEIAKEDRPDTFDEFASKIIKIDNRLYARRLERGGRNNFKPSTRRYQPNTGRRRGGSTAYGVHPGPMELDVANREKGKACYNCGKTGHFANKCKAPKKKFKPVEERKFHMAHREDLPTKNISMANSEEYVSDTNRYLGHEDPYQSVDNTSSDEDWEFGTQPVPDEDDNLALTTLDVKERRESFISLEANTDEHYVEDENAYTIRAMTSRYEAGGNCVRTSVRTRPHAINIDGRQPNRRRSSKEPRPERARTLFAMLEELEQKKSGNDSRRCN